MLTIINFEKCSFAFYFSEMYYVTLFCNDDCFVIGNIQYVNRYIISYIKR